MLSLCVARNVLLMHASPFSTLSHFRWYKLCVHRVCGSRDTIKLVGVKFHYNNIASSA